MWHAWGIGRRLREDEHVRQVVPKVEDELQVRVGLARAALFVFKECSRIRASVVGQDAVVREAR